MEKLPPGDLTGRKLVDECGELLIRHDAPHLNWRPFWSDRAAPTFGYSRKRSRTSREYVKQTTTSLGAELQT
jgi:hypothetical protein